MKLMFVGQSNIGKTSLLTELRKLRGKDLGFHPTFPQRVSNLPGLDGKGTEVSLIHIESDLV